MDAARPSSAGGHTPSRPAARQLEVRVLGPLAVRRGDEELALGGGRPRTLFALLLLQSGRSLSVDRIVDELWGESPPPTARHMVEVYVSGLRKVLGRERIVHGPAGYAVRVDAEELDAARFERLRAEGREALAAGDARLAASRLGEALAVWRGPALAELAYEPFAQVETARLEEARLGAEEERMEAELALGREGGLVGELEELVARAPLRERRRAQLMRALVREGRQADALAAYRAARKTLVEDLGIEPGPELRELEKAILLQQEGLVAADPRADAAPERGTRRVVTLLFVEPAGAGAGADPEAVPSAAGHTAAAARAAIERHEGLVEELPDGIIMGVFGSPVAHEDDALRAIEAAAELRVRGLTARAGIETGEALAAGGTVRGEVVRAAARLREVAGPGEIVLGNEARLLAGDRVRLEPLWGDPAPAWRVVALDPPRETPPPDAPLVGREHELGRLLAAFARSRDEGRAQRVVILGEPGIGKSRLARELVARARESATVLHGHCPAYGEAVTYWPLRQAIRRIGCDSFEAIAARLAALANGEAIARRVAGAMNLLDSLHPVEEVRWAARRFVETLAAESPVVVVFDDLHWAEPALLDLLDHVAERGRGPILLVCLGRTELIERRPDWARERKRGDVLTLDPLSREESGELLEGLARARSATLGTERRRILAAAKGNPFFLEQLATFAGEGGTDERHDTGLPTTLRMLLAARLDRLAPGERAVVEYASVAGRGFWVESLRELLPAQAAESLSRHLDALTQRNLLEPRASVVPFMQAYRFRHSLIQEAAYRSLPKERRADAHERLAAWIEQAPRSAVGARERSVGHHLERACLYRAELRQLDDDLVLLARRAARHLADAGRRASARGNWSAAAGLLSRACALLPRGDGRRLELLPTLGVELAESGDPAGAEAALAQAVDEAVAAADRRVELRARLELAALRGFASPGTAAAEIRRIAAEAIPVFEEAGDDAALARAFHVLGYVEVWAVRWDAAGDVFERALEHSRDAGDAREEASLVRWAARSLLFGSTPAEAGIVRCEELLARVAGRRDAEAGVLEALASLHALRGRFEEARALHERGGRTYAALGEQARLARLSAVGTRIELLAGEQDAAERELRTALELYEASGERGFVAAVAASLARLACDAGRFDEAERLTTVAEASASAGDVTTQVRRRAAQAKVLAHRGSLAEAEVLAREAVELTEQTEFPDWQGDALLDLADVLLASGRPEEAATATRKALRLYEHKGNVASAERASTRLEQHGAAPPG